jgi:hypothetical protein
VKRLRILQAGAGALVVVLVVFGGCTEPPIGWQGAGRAQDLPPPATDASGLMDSEASLSGLPGLCVPDGVICHQPTDCCSGKCSPAGACLTPKGASAGGPYPAPDGVVCSFSSDCADGYCGASGVCGDTPSPVCAPEGVLCHETSQCCNPASEGGSGGVSCVDTGAGGVCGRTIGPTPFCVPYGVFCTDPTDCCVGTCTLNTDMQMVCDVPPM